MSIKEIGQTLLEVVVVIAVGTIVVGALVLATIASLRNAQFSKNQVQATKLAQEAIEKVKSDRDRNRGISGFVMNGAPVVDWQDSDLWNKQITNDCAAPCYFKIISSGINWIASLSGGEPLNNGQFIRVVVLSDDPSSYTSEKKITAIVSWTDFSGSHESRLTTVLRKL